MDENCNLEVDVNGEEVFIVDKRVISSYSGKIRKLLINSKGSPGRLKVIFHDFPGGAANFELMTRFCYNNGETNMGPLNVPNLSSAANYMEMNKFVSETENLLEKTEKSLDEIRYWTWPELVTALKQCQKLLPNAIPITTLSRFLDSLTVRIMASPCDDTSPSHSTSSPESGSALRFSCDTRSSASLKNEFLPSRPTYTWWFEDLAKFEPCMLELLVKLMVSRNFDNGVISKFLFHHQKSRFEPASRDERVKIMESVVDMLCSLDIRCVSHKSLFELLRVALSVKLGRAHLKILENMIGSLLDEASLDNLFIPSRARKKYLYDVSLVLRFLKSFIRKGVCCVPLSRMKKVAKLMDLYLAEIAPDPYLKPSKFLAVVKALPDTARDSFDGVYHAVNLYIEVHTSLSEEQKMNLSSILNYNKLSSEAIIHLTQNTNFPSKSAAQAVFSRQCKLKSLLLRDTDDDKACAGPKGEEGCQQIVLYAKKLDFSDENEKLKAHLQGMQWRVLELEKVCRKMQSQMAKAMIRSRSSNSNPGTNARALPHFCSK